MLYIRLIVTNNITSMLKKIVNIILLSALFYPDISLSAMKVAVIAPKSGEYKRWGDELNYGVQVAIDEINHDGGIKGKKLELFSIDDACSDNLAVSTAQMLAVGLENKPVVVIGPYCTNAFEQISQIYSGAKIFQIVPTSLNYNSAMQEHQGMVRMGGFKEQASRDFFQFYNTHFAGKKVAILLNSEDPSTTTAFNLVYEEFRKFGKSSLVTNYDFANQDLNDLAQRITDNQEEVVAIAGTPKATAKMIRNLKQNNKDIIIVTSKYALGDSLFEYAQDYLDGVYFVALPTMEDNPDFAEILVKLRLRGIEMKGLNIYGYTALKTWADMVSKANSFAYDDLSELVKKEGVEALSDTMLFNNGGVENPIHYEFYEYKDGEYVKAD